MMSDSKNLFHKIRALPDSHTLWKAPSCSVSKDDMRYLLSKNSDWLAEISGKVVGIQLSSTLETIAILVLMDGIAEDLVLVPSDTDSDVAESVGQRCALDVWLTDDHRPGENSDRRVITPDFRNWPVSDERHAENTTESCSIERSSSSWILLTSGTTGTPKPIKHSLASLSRAVSTNLKYQHYRWGLVYSVYRFAGLQVVLQALLNSSILLIPDSEQSLGKRVRFLAEHKCNALSCTPTLWKKILMTGAVDALSLRQITLGGEIADSQVLKALRRSFPDANITHIYASTEAGVGFAVHDGREGFPANYLDDPPGDVEISISKQGHLLLRPPERDQALMQDDSSLFDADGWIDTGDRVERRGDRYVFVGRADGAINIAGNTVYPEKIEGVITEIEGVAMAAVRARDSSLVGQLLEAEIVSDGDIEDAKLETRVLNHCRNILPNYEIPRLVRVVDSIATTDAGKISRD